MTNDGTQDPVPPPAPADPVSGLVTGARYEPEPPRARVTEPPMPDIAAMREAMAHVLDENSELRLDAITPADEFFTDSTASAGGDAPSAPAEVPATQQPAQPAGKPVAQVPVAQVPTQAPGQAPPSPATVTVTGLPHEVPTRGAVTRVFAQPVNIPAPRDAEAGPAQALPPAASRGERTRRIRLPSGFLRRRSTAPSGVPGQSSAGSVALILSLLGVMIVLGIVALASLIDTIATVLS